MKSFLKIQQYTIQSIVFVFLFFTISYPQVWVKKIGNAGLGNPFAYNPLNSDILYASPGNNHIYVSRDRGYTWASFGNAVPAGGTVKSIAVNPLDTNQLVVGEQGASGQPSRVIKTTNGGLTWVTTLFCTFNYFGKPVEFKNSHPDTIYTMSNDTIWRSIDFGSTWDTVRRVTGLFNAWCDAEVRPDSANIILVGDNASGIWKSTDHGFSWRQVYSTTGEVPSIAIDPFNPQIAYASRFGGGGGFLKTTNGGESWNALTTPINTGNSWWVTTSPVSPGYVYFGTYGANPYGPFMSRNSGATWTQIASPDTGQPTFSQFNYGMMVTDTLTVLTLQGDGLWKLKFREQIHLTSPNGGEYFHAGTVHTITWSDSNISKVNLEFTTNNGSTWNAIASVNADLGSYIWEIPNTPSGECKVRISNFYSSSVLDTSDSAFTIYEDPITVLIPNGGESWDVGSSRIVSWVSSVPLTTKLEFSTNNGATWNYIATIDPNIFSYPWVLPDVHSQTCLVRIADFNDSTTADESDSDFEIYSVVQFTASLVVNDDYGNIDTLHFGALEGATVGVDSAFGEEILPPKAGEGNFDARWRITGNNGMKRDYRDTLGAMNPSNSYFGEIQPSALGYPITISWNPESLRAGTYILRDTVTHGSLFSMNMRADDSLVIQDSTKAGFEIFECSSQTLIYSGNGSWDIISVPFLTGNLKKDFVFPVSSSDAFGYNSGYFSADSLQYGMGYWMKTKEVTIVGCPRTLDTIDLQSKWNMIGGLSDEVNIASIVMIPDSNISSFYYGYNNGYTIATSLSPGEGYWVKAKSPGKLILSTETFSKKDKKNQAVEMLKALNSLTLTTGEGASQTIYFGSSELVLLPEFFEMPPPPPENSFDLRFSNQSLVEIFNKTDNNGQEKGIFVKSPSNKNIFTWNVENDKNFYYILTCKTNGCNAGETRLTGSGSISLKSLDGETFTLKALRLGDTPVPTTYSLSQNYPNPFNPVTHVRYSLPHNARVTIRIFNIIGEVVSDLVEENKPRGVHEIEWDGTARNGVPLPSGVYYMMMRVVREDASSTDREEYSTVRKLMLLK